MTRTPKRPRDTNQLAKFIVDVTSGEIDDQEPSHSDDGKNAAAVSLGRRGGIKGGRARADSLSPEQRAEAARIAAQARWRRRTS